MNAIAVALGTAFGFVLSWAGMTDPDAIRAMLLLEDAYLFLVFACSVGTAFVGLRLVRRGRPGCWWEPRARIERRHLSGSVMFGLGWSIASSCPGPIAAQLGQGMLWSLCTIGGIATGMVLYGRLASVRSARAEREPGAAVARLEGAPG